MAMLIRQLSDRKSLRDITDNLKAQHARVVSSLHEANFKGNIDPGQ
jgi:hypothetical protein